MYTHTYVLVLLLATTVATVDLDLVLKPCQSVALLVLLIPVQNFALKSLLTPVLNVVERLWLVMDS